MNDSNANAEHFLTCDNINDVTVLSGGGFEMKKWMYDINVLPQMLRKELSRQKRVMLAKI